MTMKVLATEDFVRICPDTSNGSLMNSNLAPYETQHTIGYVYAAPEFATAVYLAVRDLMWSEHELSFDDASWTRTKLKSKELLDFSRIVEGKDSTHHRFIEPPCIIERRALAQRNEQKIDTIKSIRTGYRNWRNAARPSRVVASPVSPRGDPHSGPSA
jgi:hypothetical protein